MKNLYKLITLFTVLFLFGCIDDRAGHFGASNDIKDEKRRGVFIAEMCSHPNPYKINDTLQITVKEAWVESMWKYTKDDPQVEKCIDRQFKYQICINTTNKDVEKLNSMLYGLEIGESEYKRLHLSSSTSLMGYLTTLPSDSLEYMVIMDSVGKKQHILGRFILKNR